jgi:hypothetical protein
MKRKFLALFLLGGVVFGYGSALHHAVFAWHGGGGCPHAREAAPPPAP